MRISERQIGDVVVLDVVGRLVGRNAAEVMTNSVRRAGQTGAQTVVVNLERVRSVDLTGLGALVDAYSLVRGLGIEMKLASLTSRIHDLVIITRLLTVFDTCESADEAVYGAAAPAASFPAPERPTPVAFGMIQRLLHRA